MEKKIKVFAIAYACEPDKGSEPGVGWGWVNQISRFADVCVVTRTNNKNSIEHEINNNPNPNLRFTYVDLPKYLTFWKRKERGVRLYYYLWQVYGVFKTYRFFREFNPQIIHQVTFVNDYMPSFYFLFKLFKNEVKFVWGPVGSHLPVPKEFVPNTSDYIFDRLRIITHKIMRKDPFFGLTKKYSDFIIGTNHHVKEKLRLKEKNNFYILPAIAVNEVSHGINIKKTENEPVTICFTGRFVYLKGVLLAFYSFINLLNLLNGTRQVQLLLIGGGKYSNYLQELSESMGVSDKVSFTGWIPREQVLEKMNNSDVFLFPSFEGGGMVVLEAMSLSLPVVCLDYGGPGRMVSNECGIKVKVSTFDKTAKQLSEALLELVNDTERRIEMGKNGKKRVDNYFTWERKKEEIQKIYQDLIK